MGRPGFAAVAALAVLTATGANTSDAAAAVTTPPADAPGAVAVPLASPLVSPPSAELRVSGSVAPDPMVAGGTSVYTLTVTNAGAGDARDVVLTGVLDRHVSPGPLPGGCRFAGRTVTCAGLELPAGHTVTYEIPLTTGAAVPEGTDIVHRAEVTAPGQAGDAVQFVTPTRSVSDVEVVKRGRRAARAGGRIAYTLTVTNRGPSRATGVTVHDSPGGTLAERPAACPGTGADVVCTVGALGPNKSRTFRYTVTSDTPGRVGGCATVRTGGRDGNPANDTSCARTRVKQARSPKSASGEAEETTAGQADRLPEDERVVVPLEEPRAPYRGERRRSRPVANDDAEPADAPVSATLPLAGTSWRLLGLSAALLLGGALVISCLSRQSTGRRRR